MSSAREWCDLCKDEHGEAYNCYDDPYSRGNIEKTRLENEKREKEKRDELAKSHMDSLLNYRTNGLGQKYSDILWNAGYRRI